MLDWQGGFRSMASSLHFSSPLNTLQSAKQFAHYTTVIQSFIGGKTQFQVKYAFLLVVIEQDPRTKLPYPREFATPYPP